MPSILATTFVVFDRSHTKGDAITDMNFMGPATILDTFSDALIPIFFGTSSPKIRVRNITRMTIIVLDKAMAPASAIPAP